MAWRGAGVLSEPEPLAGWAFGEFRAMLDRDDLRRLTAWCAARRLRWQPARSDSGEQAVLLDHAGSRQPWRRMEVLADPAGYRLRDEAGATLAVASDLSALLDAVDAGVADAPAAGPRRQPARDGARAERHGGVSAAP